MTTGIVATFGVIMHEFPEGLSIMSILFHAGFGRRRALGYSIAVALATPFGAVVSSALLQSIEPPLLGVLLGIAAGSFLYIAASELIPETRRRANPYNVPLVAAGMVTLLALDWLLR